MTLDEKLDWLQDKLGRANVARNKGTDISPSNWVLVFDRCRTIWYGSSLEAAVDVAFNETLTPKDRADAAWRRRYNGDGWKIPVSLNDAFTDGYLACYEEIYK